VWLFVGFFQMVVALGVGSVSCPLDDVYIKRISWLFWFCGSLSGWSEVGQLLWLAVYVVDSKLITHLKLVLSRMHGAQHPCKACTLML
jgi:hypothetical protein